MRRLVWTRGVGRLIEQREFGFSLRLTLLTSQTAMLRSIQEED
jgi:hypothetical protein